MIIESEDHIELHLRRALDHLETARILADAAKDPRGDRAHETAEKVRSVMANPEGPS